MKSSNARLIGVYVVIIIIVSLFMFSCDSPSKRLKREREYQKTTLLGVTLVVGVDKYVGETFNKKFFKTNSGDTVGVYNYNVKEIRKINVTRFSGETEKIIVAYEIKY